MKKKILFQLLFTLTISFVPFMLLIGQSNTPENEDNGFEIIVTDSDYSLAYAKVIVLTNKKLDVIFKGEIVGEKDSVIFSRLVNSSDTLRQIKRINLQKLKSYYYSNKFGNDGLQMSVSIKKNGKRKTVYLDNYYQEDIGKMIYLINSLLPDKYKIWYDKKQLQNQ